jgi:hypothetical protein
MLLLNYGRRVMNMKTYLKYIVELTAESGYDAAYETVELEYDIRTNTVDMIPLPKYIVGQNEGTIYYNYNKKIVQIIDPETMDPLIILNDRL